MITCPILKKELCLGLNVCKYFERDEGCVYEKRDKAVYKKMAEGEYRKEKVKVKKDES